MTIEHSKHTPAENEGEYTAQFDYDFTPEDADDLVEAINVSDTYKQDSLTSALAEVNDGSVDSYIKVLDAKIIPIEDLIDQLEKNHPHVHERFLALYAEHMDRLHHDQVARRIGRGAGHIY